MTSRSFARITLIILTSIVYITTLASNPLIFTDDFDTNILNWTECEDCGSGSAIINDGTLLLKSNGENKTAGALITVLCGVPTSIGENTFFETHCYAPIDITLPFEITANVIIDRLADERICGFVFNYRDNGNFDCINLNDKTINYTRFVNNYIVGNIMKGLKWPYTKNVKQDWRFIYNNGNITFYINDIDVLNVKHMPIDFSGIGFCVYGKQTLTVDNITFNQY